MKAVGIDAVVLFNLSIGDSISNVIFASRHGENHPNRCLLPAAMGITNKTKFLLTTRRFVIGAQMGRLRFNWS